MRSSNSRFDERGHDSLVRDVEELALQLTDLGVEAEGFSAALAAQAQQTNDAISEGIAQHEAKSNPHPQYLLTSAYTPAPSAAVGFSAYNISGGALTGAYATLTSWTSSYDSGSTFSAGTFTAPSSGTYRVSAVINCSLNQGAVAGTISGVARILQNGGATSLVTGASGYVTAFGSVISSMTLDQAIAMSSSDTLVLQAAAGGTSSTLYAVFFTVLRIGD